MLGSITHASASDNLLYLLRSLEEGDILRVPYSVRHPATIQAAAYRIAAMLDIKFSVRKLPTLRVTDIIRV